MSVDPLDPDRTHETFVCQVPGCAASVASPFGCAEEHEILLSSLGWASLAIHAPGPILEEESYNDLGAQSVYLRSKHLLTLWFSICPAHARAFLRAFLSPDILKRALITLPPVRP